MYCALGPAQTLQRWIMKVKVSLKLTAKAPENRPKRPKSKRQYSNHPFSGATVDGSEIRLTS